MKYRKKPIVIEAFKLGHSITPEWFDNIPCGEIVLLNNGVPSSHIVVYPNNNLTALIKTPEGEMLANNGDYIIKGINGEIYPCKTDIFEMTYEKVE